jgi:hypothetical protein
VPPGDQTPPFMAALEMTRRPLLDGQACVHAKAQQLGFSVLYFLILTLFSFLTSIFYASPSKNQIHPLVCICINFGSYSFDYYLFCF